MEAETYAIEVPLKDFVAFLKAARVGKRLGKRNIASEVVEFRFSGEVLSISLMGVTHAIPAKGRWPGAVHIGLASMQSLVKVPPTLSPLCLRVHEGRLSIGTTVFPAKVDR